MFGNLISRLTAPQTPQLSDEDARLSLAALLVRIARSDGDYAEAEMAQIDKVLARRYGLSPFEATSLRARGEDLERQAPDTVRFTRVIKEAVPYEERIAVIEALWAVALADGERDSEEDSILRMAANFLGVNDRDSALARQRVDSSGA
ncbi:Tellurite resistance protein TerB [Pseudoruegeria aquimaris]|uniref:Tellurite resistance protein TerB n=1 Tax=Pseudoruegeria aquimaris TaxID=393663 RepID=A0A1Y5RH37_9RHOB|nr:TerB family tellurite resistance protein [Pseudoruegeria aquimaris]SLN17003.1 Tellurite resistance protein TerB [Pseudoruegeria aquimaris]